MAAREHKVASLSLTRTVGKALSDVLNGKPNTSSTGKAAASAMAPPNEFGGGPTKTATSIKRMSLPTGIRSGLPTAAGLGAGTGTGAGAGAGLLPSAGSGRASSRSSQSTTTSTTDKLPSVAEDTSVQSGGPTLKVPARVKPVRLAAPAAIAGSALPKFKPKAATAAAATAAPAPANKAPSPVRLGTRKRRPSNESSSAVTTSTDEPSTESPTDSTSKPDRPLSPLPKRVLKKAAAAPARPKSPPVPKASPKPSLKENELRSSSTTATGKSESRNGSPPKKIARQSSSTTTSPVTRSSLRSPVAQSTPSPTLAKAKLAAANAAARTPPASSSRAAARAAQIMDQSPGNSSTEVSMMLEGVTLDPDAPSPFIPRTRPFPRTPSSNSVLSARSRMSKALFDPRGSVLSWEDMSRSFGHNTDELGTFLTTIDAPFTPGDRSMSMYSDTAASSTWGSPQHSAAPHTPGMSISQMMFPPAALDVGDVSFGSDGAELGDDETANSSGMSFQLGLSPDVRMDVDRRSRRAGVVAENAATKVFGPGPSSPDNNQAAMLVLQMQLAGMNEIREERDSLRRALEEARSRDEEATAERDALRAERDNVQIQLDQIAIEKNMLQDIAQEERVSRVEAEDIARAVSLRDANLRKRLKGEGMRAAAAEWMNAAEALRLEVERIRGERTLLDVLSVSAKTAAAIAA